MQFDAILLGLSLVSDPYNIFLIFCGVLIGVMVGALPGLSSPMAVALLLPFTVGLEPIQAISMLAALYCAGTFGGSITAILINAPGAPPAALRRGQRRHLRPDQGPIDGIWELRH